MGRYYYQNLKQSKNKLSLWSVWGECYDIWYFVQFSFVIIVHSFSFKKKLSILLVRACFSTYIYMYVPDRILFLILWTQFGLSKIEGLRPELRKKEPRSNFGGDHILYVSLSNLFCNLYALGQLGIFFSSFLSFPFLHEKSRSFSWKNKFVPCLTEEWATQVLTVSYQVKKKIK